MWLLVMKSGKNSRSNNVSELKSLLTYMRKHSDDDGFILRETH